MARVRDLTRWNDQPGRTREQVLGLVDLAAGHAVMGAMRRPSGARDAATPASTARS
jgi:hypothetical protein